MWCAIILAGGSGSRMGAGRNKVLLSIEGETVLCRSVRAFLPRMEQLVLVVRPEDETAIHQALAASGLADAPIRFALGGADRQASVWSGLCALPAECDHVLIHDGARCLVDEGTIRRVMAAVEASGTGVAAVPVTDTIKQADAAERSLVTLKRDALRAVQTPQGFDTVLIRKAHQAAQADGFRGTDDASLLEHLGMSVQLVPGSRSNIKLTTPEDLTMAEAFLHSEAQPPALRVGQGYDVHRLVADRPLVLCGVEVPHSLGLLGHSDADVALHALMDAMLGAMALGDIGQHFPDSDQRYSGISSMTLLCQVVAMLEKHGARLVNVDVTIVAQRPKLASYIPAMRANVADALSLPLERVSIKATTTERLGFEGHEEGISAQAVCLVSAS